MIPFPDFMHRVAMLISLPFVYPVCCVLSALCFAIHGAAKEVRENFPSLHAYMIECIKLGWKGK